MRLILAGDGSRLIGSTLSQTVTFLQLTSGVLQELVKAVYDIFKTTDQSHLQLQPIFLLSRESRRKCYPRFSRPTKVERSWAKANLHSE